jgi:arginine exporter protein ArgO
MVAGVFAGSALWWLGLSSAVALAHRALSVGMMRWIDRLSALILIAFGAAAASGLL